MRNEAAIADHEQFQVRRTVRIRAPRAVVWAALTDPSQISQWFGQRATFPEGVHVGALGTFGWRDDADLPVRIDRFEPESHFDFTWGTPGEEIQEGNSTTAHFTVRQDGTDTVVNVTETGFDAMGKAAARRAALEDHAQGWSAELDEFVEHVEGLTARPASASPASGPAAVADLDAGTITRTVLVHAPRRIVWASLTGPEQIEQWWGHPAQFPDGMSEGSLGTFEWVGHGLMPIRIERFEPEARFHLTWGALGDPQPGRDASRVEFTVTGAGEDTLVTVVEAGFTTQDAAARRAAMEDNVGGWNTVLDHLAVHAEGVRV